MLTQKKSLQWTWLILIALYILSAPFEGYLVIPGFHGHSLVSLLQRLLLIPLPVITLYTIIQYKDYRTIWPLGIITAWLIWVLMTFLAFSPHTYYYLYYTWEQIAGFLLILSFWYLARFPIFSRITTISSLLIYYVVTLIVSFWEIRTAHHLGHSSEGGLHPQPIPTAFFYGPNHLGAALALMFPFVLFLFLLKPSARSIVLSGVMSLGGLYVLYKTGSRGGELALFMEFFGLVIILPRRYKPYAMISLGILLAVLVTGLWYVTHLPAQDKLPFALEKFRHLAHLFHPTFHKVTPTQGPGSLQIRLALLESGYHALLHHPWGLGPRGAERYYLYYVHHKSPYNTYGVIDAHNMWLEIAIDFGWLGIGLYIIFYSMLLRGLYRLRQHPDPVLRYLSWAGFISLIGFLIGSVSPSSVMIGFNIMWIVYGMAIMAMYQGTLSQNRSRLSFQKRLP